MHFRSYMSPAVIAFVALFAVVMNRLALFVGLFALVFSAGCGAASGSNSNGNGASVLATVSGTVAVGTAPSGIAVDSTSNKIYVADFGTPPPQTQFLTCPPAGWDVTVINGATESTSTVAIQPPRSAIDPVAIALNETSPSAYVVAQGWGGEPC
jgi:DNA-binding beta-propeller fold protein YncE